MAPSPGQIAYAAFMRDAYPGDYQAWFWLPIRDQHGWEAVAEAVLDAWQAQPRLETPPRKRTQTRSTDQ